MLEKEELPVISYLTPWLKATVATAWQLSTGGHLLERR